MTSKLIGWAEKQKEEDNEDRKEDVYNLQDNIYSHRVYLRTNGDPCIEDF
jgi:hypothetical protein